VKRTLIEPEHPQLSVARQCALLGLARSRWYYTPQGESAENLELMRRMDEQYTQTPFYGIRRMTAWLRQRGHAVNHKRVGRLLRLMGLEALYPKPRLSMPAAGEKRYPYLLRGLTVARSDHVWSTDITYIRMQHGFLYLVAILDWYSRFVLAWELSNTLDTGFCLAALETALTRNRPEIFNFNTDQGSQFTSQAYTSRLAQAGSKSVGMGAVGR
jgi:putative transposase